MFECKVLADSINDFDCRLTTFKIVFPRYILAEMNTHRMFSRNSASSRAIPFEKMVKSVQDSPFIPMAWMKDHKGMQGTEYIIDYEEIDYLENSWLQARDRAVSSAYELNGQGATKQLCNRLLEPFMWHTVIVTASEWKNFFALRCPKYELFIKNPGKFYSSKKDLLKDFPEYILNTEMDWLTLNKGQADIHMMEIAEMIWDAYNESIPKLLKEEECHIPFGDQIDEKTLIALTNKENDRAFEEHNTHREFVAFTIDDIKLMIATARCARISYQTLGDDPKIDYEADIKLHNNLAKSGHWSPFEHCARSMNQQEYVRNITGILEDGKFEIPSPSNESEGWSGNFRGFIQYRKMFKNENIK